jgi:uncharacterized membrane protein (DUF485 family)
MGRRRANTLVSGVRAEEEGFPHPGDALFMVFFFGLPILASFTTVLNARAIGPLTWAYVYGFAQFAMTWIMMHLYVNRANKWDNLVVKARREAAETAEQEGLVE